MAYSITLSSSVDTVVNSETYQLKLIFTVDLTASNESYTFGDKNIVIMDHGKTEWGYDVEDALLMPQSLNIKISDKDGYVDDLLFGTGAVPVAIDKKFRAEIYINGSLEFKGNAIEDSMTSIEIINIGSDTSYEISFQAYPELDLLNKKTIYDGSTAINPFSYSAGTSELITDMIDSCWQVLNAGITVTYDQDWLFSGDRYVPASPPNAHDGFVFTDLELKVDPIWFDSNRNVNSVGDVLKLLAKDYGCFTGLKNFNDAFFKKLFKYDSGNTQSLGDIISYEKFYRYSLIDYARMQSTLPSTWAEAGTFTLLEGRYMEIDQYAYDPDGKILRAEIVGGGEAGTYKIPRAYDPDWQSVYGDINQLLVDFWFRFRGDITKIRADKMVVIGVTYDILKNFTYNGFKYQIINMIKDFEQGTTEIIALNLGT